MAKIDKNASKKFGVKVVRSDKPKSETPKKKSWEKKIEKASIHGGLRSLSDCKPLIY